MASEATGIADEDLSSPDDLTLHIENIMKVIGSDGDSLWKELQTLLSIPINETGNSEQKDDRALLKDVLEKLLERPDTSWKLLIDTLNKAPDPGPKIAAIIATRHSELAREEEQQRNECENLLRSAANEQLDLPTMLTREKCDVGEFLKSFDSTNKRWKEKMDEVTQMLQKSNEEFLKDVKRGESYWKSKQREEQQLNASIAGTVEQVTAIVMKLKAAFEDAKKHYSKCSEVECKLHKELAEAKKYLNEEYFKKLEVRIARLGQLGSNKIILLNNTYDILKRLSSTISVAEENYAKCTAQTTDCKQYMHKLWNDLKIADGALDRILSDLNRYKNLKQEELQKWDTVKAWALGIGIAGAVFAPFTFGITLLVSGGATAAFLITRSYLNDAREAVSDYEKKINHCSACSRNIQTDLIEMERDLKK